MECNGAHSAERVVHGLQTGLGDGCIILQQDLQRWIFIYDIRHAGEGIQHLAKRHGIRRNADYIFKKYTKRQHRLSSLQQRQSLFLWHSWGSWTRQYANRSEQKDTHWYSYPSRRLPANGLTLLYMGSRCESSIVTARQWR